MVLFSASWELRAVSLSVIEEWPEMVNPRGAVLRRFRGLFSLCLLGVHFGLFLVSQVLVKLAFEVLYVELEFFMLADLVV
jgi:hypothetical protein